MEDTPKTRVFRNRRLDYSEFNAFGKSDHGVASINAPANSYANFGGDRSKAGFSDERDSLDPDGKLFSHWHTPAKLHLLTATGKQHVAPLIGMAVNEAKERWGETLKPSHDLSPHSARLVSKLRDRGVVGSSASSRVTNTMDTENAESEERYQRGRLGEHDEGVDGLGDHEGNYLVGHEQSHSMYRQGGQMMRQAIRNARPTNASTQFDQIHPNQGKLF